MEQGKETQYLEKRFGIVAVENGFITAEQLIDALKVQILEDVENGKHRLIGRILLEQKAMPLEQIDKVLDILGKGLPLLKKTS